MSVSKIYEEVGSGVLHFVFEKGGQRVGSGSGFMLNGHAVTNHHVYRDSFNFLTKIHFWKDGVCNKIEFSPGKLAAHLVHGSDENSHDYAVLNVPSLKGAGLYQFNISSSGPPKPGLDVLVLGFPFEIDRLTIHRGIISAVYKSGLATVFQIDASVNPSNSGGPLIDAATGDLLGIVTRRHTGLTNQFEQLVHNIRASIGALDKIKAQGGSVSMMGLDPIEATRVIFNQMHVFAIEVYRSANVGIGYAFSLEAIATDMNL